MMLWHIDDFEQLVDTVPRPWPWSIVGVMPTRDEYMALGNHAYDPHHAFCYTVSRGPTEVWCPMSSVEGRFCQPELIAVVVNVIYTATHANQLLDGDNMIVPFNHTVPDTDVNERRDGVFWIGHTVDDPDHARYHCYATPHTQILPIRWSSPLGFSEN